MKISTLTKFVLITAFSSFVFVVLDAIFGKASYNADTILMIGFAITWAIERDNDKRTQGANK